MDPRLPFYARSTQAVRVNDLLTSLRDGMLRVPRFERGFKWRDRQRVALLDSIYRGYPIGALLVWRTAGQSLAVSGQIGGLPVAQAGGGSADFLLDGLQRMTTLYAALAPALFDATDGPETRFPSIVETEDGARSWVVAPERREWEVVFRVDQRTFSEIPADGRVPPRCVPLSVLLDTFQLSEFLRNSDVASDRETARRIDDLQTRLRDYQVPVIPLLHSELHDAIESFRRLNTYGTRMQETDLLRALSWRPEFDLSERLAPIQRAIRESGWGHVEEDVLVDLCKLEVGLAPYSYAPEKFGELVRGDDGVFDRVRANALRTVEFLREHCGVAGASSLPFAFQFVLLAHALPARYADHPEMTARAVTWFWQTTWTHFFASQRRISQALKNLIAWLRGALTVRLVDDDSVECAGRFDFRRARDKGLSLMLARHATRPHDAARLLGERGRDGLQPLIPEFRHRRLAAGNVVIARDDEIADLRAKLLGSSGPRDPALLSAHAIDPVANAHLRQGDLEGFVRARLDHLRSLERAEVERLGLRYVVVDLPDDPGGDGPLFDREEPDRDD